MSFRKLLPRRAVDTLRRHTPPAVRESIVRWKREPTRILDTYSLNARYETSARARMRAFIDTSRKLSTSRRLLFYPVWPKYWYLIHKLCLRSGHRMVTSPHEPFDLALKWHDTTFSPTDEVLLGLKRSAFVVNGDCVDISKETVDHMHQQVFGYSLAVDPRSHGGKFVEKPNANCAGPVTVIDAPMDAAREGYVYQRFIEAVDDSGMLVDMRISIVGNDIPVVRTRFWAFDGRRLKGDCRTAIVQAASDVLSPAEAGLLLELVGRLGVDFGEVDALRDPVDGRLYVVDVNSTPTGPNQGLDHPERLEVIDRLARAFDQTFLAS